MENLSITENGMFYLALFQKHCNYPQFLCFYQLIVLYKTLTGIVPFHKNTTIIHNNHYFIAIFKVKNFKKPRKTPGSPGHRCLRVNPHNTRIDT
mgnify:CR=1 FL=1